VDPSVERGEAPVYSASRLPRGEASGRFPPPRRLPRRAFRGAFRAPFGEQLKRAIEVERLGIVAAPEARVRLTVGDVRAELPLLDDDRLARRRIVAELRERRLGLSAATPLLRLRQPSERLLKRDREELLLALDGARLLRLLDVRPVRTVLCEHLRTVGRD